MNSIQVAWILQWIDTYVDKAWQYMIHDELPFAHDTLKRGFSVLSMLDEYMQNGGVLSPQESERHGYLKKHAHEVLDRLLVRDKTVQ